MRLHVPARQLVLLLLLAALWAQGMEPTDPPCHAPPCTGASACPPAASCCALGAGYGTDRSAMPCASMYRRVSLSSCCFLLRFGRRVWNRQIRHAMRLHVPARQLVLLLLLAALW